MLTVAPDGEIRSHHEGTKDTKFSDKIYPGLRELRGEYLIQLLLLRATWMIGHVALRAGRFHRRFKVFVDLRILVLELDLIAAEFEARVGASFAVR